MLRLSLPRQRFIEAVRQPDDQIDLERAALYMAQEEYPDLDVEDYINALDVMAEELRERLPQTLYPLKVIQTINRYLYDDLQFAGNSLDYYDPRNSYLNQVIDRRVGIPITLALVYLAIARRVDFPMVGVGMPGHFLIRPIADEMEVFVDPFNSGETLFRQDCEALLQQVYQQPVPLRSEFLDAVSHRQFLLRMLGNLKAIHLNRGDMHNALAAIERILILYPEAIGELRDRGILYFQMQRWTEARQDLEQYLDQTPSAQDRSMIQQLLSRIDQGRPS
ncbi:MAG: transglutaminase-like domain-containing protein [Synechococcales bacterium]|nr:transglutaminase-like domain-containing protein [Synechococcales bacterium]